MTPWTVALQTPLSMGFSRQEYWSGLPFPATRYNEAIVLNAVVLAQGRGKKIIGHNRESRKRLTHTQTLDLGHSSLHLAMARASLLNK